MFEIPVVIVVFNRPVQTRRLISVLREVKPQTLFIIGDGPRNNSSDIAKTSEVKNILNEIDWDCNVMSNFSEVNMGCQKRVASGLSWVFNLVDQAIILEDDCIPNMSFFEYCKDNLELYKDDRRIMSISGTRLAPVKSNDVVFSKYSICWGWATWSRAWECYDESLDDLNLLKQNDFFKLFFGSKRASLYWHYIFNKLKLNKMNSWAYRWMLSCWRLNGLSVVPPRNLIENIGEGVDATHTKTKNKFLRVGTIELNDYSSGTPVHHDLQMDQWIEDNFYSKSIVNRISWLIKKCPAKSNKY
jgi:hypothetical protein